MSWSLSVTLFQWVNKQIFFHFNQLLISQILFKAWHFVTLSFFTFFLLTDEEAQKFETHRLHHDSTIGRQKKKCEIGKKWKHLPLIFVSDSYLLLFNGSSMVSDKKNIRFLLLHLSAINKTVEIGVTSVKNRIIFLVKEQIHLCPEQDPEPH